MFRSGIVTGRCMVRCFMSSQARQIQSRALFAGASFVLEPLISVRRSTSLIIQLMECADGVRIDGETVYWKLSTSLPFMSYEALRGVSADGIYFTAPADSDDTSQESMFAKGISPEFETDSWMQINLELQSSLQPSSLHGQKHTVTLVSLGMVWQMSAEDYPPELSPSLFNLVPSRMDWESSVPSGVF